MTDLQPKHYSLPEAARLVGKSVGTIRLLMKTRHIGQKKGASWYLTEQDIDALRAIPGTHRKSDLAEKK